MIDTLLRWFVKFALWLRYRIRVRGLREVARRGTSGVLFLPNHPALIDPIIVGATLLSPFRARFLADEEQIDRFFIRTLARRINVIPIPDPSRGTPGSREAIERGIRRCAEALRNGDNVVIYPAGRLVKSRREDLRGNTGVRRILAQAPDARVVLVRTTGLWGSRFSYAWGRVPDVAAVLRRGVLSLLACGVLFAPRRRVELAFVEADGLPGGATGEQLNRRLEAFYNEDAPPAEYIPYTWWERGGRRELPEPRFEAAGGDLSAVPETTRRTVAEFLREESGLGEVRDEQHLARDLGLDSLARAELLTWLAGEFGTPPGDVDSLRTVGDVMLAASGQALAARLEAVTPPPAKWFGEDEIGEPLQLPAGRNIAEVFLAQARRGPGRCVTADQIGGVRTYRDVATAVMVLRPVLERLEGERLGILLPAGVAADVVYLAAVFAGKTPVMINWTVGDRNLRHCLDLVDVRRVVTARRLTERLAGRGVDLAALEGRLEYLEDLAGGVSKAAKLAAALRARVSWATLDLAAARLAADAPAVILFTSGSEALPKAVGLSHANILANIADIAALGAVRRGDRLLGILPPFHSFGLTVTTVLPLCLGAAVAHHPDPTEAPTLGRIIEAYRTTIMVGTPTFLDAIARAATREQLASLRLAVTGAEKCPDRTYDRLAKVQSNMEVMEGYGVTECSPILSVNRPGRSRRGTIGEPLPSIEWAIVDADTLSRRVEPGRRGMLLVRGPSVFAGYMHHEGEGPFVDFEGERWYRTGDLVVEEPGGVLRFAGRLKRFVKIGGEMVSLPAIEAVLTARLAPEPSDTQEPQGPSLAVESSGAEGQVEIVLITTRPVTREQANCAIRDAGLSPIHNIRRVVRVDAIPLLGTGKIDYRELRMRLGGDNRDERR